jgi:hypothetical protein
MLLLHLQLRRVVRFLHLHQWVRHHLHPRLAQLLRRHLRVALLLLHHHLRVALLLRPRQVQDFPRHLPQRLSPLDPKPRLSPQLLTPTQLSQHHRLLQLLSPQHLPHPQAMLLLPMPRARVKAKETMPLHHRHPRHQPLVSRPLLSQRTLLFLTRKARAKERVLVLRLLFPHHRLPLQHLVSRPQP